MPADLGKMMIVPHGNSLSFSASWTSVFLALLSLSKPGWAAEGGAVDWEARKGVWRQRIEAVRASGRLPIIDVESSYWESYMNPAAALFLLESQGVVLSAWSIEEEPSRVDARGYAWWRGRWREVQRGIEERFPGRLLPMPSVTGVISPVRGKDDPSRVLDDVLATAEAGGYPMLGEFFFRRYPNLYDLQRGGEWDVEISEPIDGSIGRRLFEFSQRTGIPFQIHYETEDALIPPLEEMLRRYPRARVVWCHAGRVRLPEKAPLFAARWSRTLRRLLEEHPNLYFDVSSIDSGQSYPLGGKPASLWWDRGTGKMEPEGVSLASDHPWRFLAAFDLGLDRAWNTRQLIARTTSFLESLPPDVREIVAYRAAWKLLFGEELPARSRGGRRKD